ncbi:MAG: hypothetical protein JW910_06165 [Anaerolineae bacterium]|nr:hypothetical protein [Anaerolineae bacterium]
MSSFLSAIDQQDGNDGAIDVLGEVSLTFFKAQPTVIGPFGASVISWEVKGPPGFHVRLNGQNAGKTGQQVVQPSSAATYRLSAHAGQASRSLGTVQVTVDRATCASYEISNPRSAIEAPVRAGINNSADLYFRDSPGLAVTFSPGRIRLQLRLKNRVNNFPDPSVDIDASFGLAVHDGTLEPVAEQISVDVSVPWWAWLIPGAPIGLAIAIDMAKDGAKKDVHEMIQSLGQLLNFFATPPLGQRLSTVRVDNGNNGAGLIELTACTQNLLVKYAELSEAVILT